MRPIIIILGMVLVSVVTCPSLVGEAKSNQKTEALGHVADLKTRPGLGVDYTRVAKFKLGSRKTTYRIGEMFSIDLAMMNVSGAAVLFHRLNRPSLELMARDAKGISVPINTYYTVLEAVTPKSYQRVEPGNILSGSFQLLAGCDDANLQSYSRARKELEEQEHDEGEEAFFRGVFERNLFVNWGEACFAINIPGTYTITAEQSNDYVVVSALVGRVKTAVGRIRSSTLSLTITE